MTDYRIVCETAVEGMCIAWRGTDPYNLTDADRTQIDTTLNERKDFDPALVLEERARTSWVTVSGWNY